MLQINDAPLYKYQTFLFWINFNAFKEFNGKLNRFYFHLMKINDVIAPKRYILKQGCILESLIAKSRALNVFATWNIKKHLHSFVS